MTILDHALVPVSGPKDAAQTCRALEPYLDTLNQVRAIHVVEKSGGGIDKAPVSQRSEAAVEAFSIIEQELGDRVTLTTQTIYAPDIVDALNAEATATDVTSILFRARGGSRIVQLLAGDTALKLVTNPPVPVVSLPTAGDQ